MATNRHVLKDDAAIIQRQPLGMFIILKHPACAYYYT